MPAACFDPLCLIFREEPNHSLTYKTRNSDKIRLKNYIMMPLNYNRNVNCIPCEGLDFTTAEWDCSLLST